MLAKDASTRPVVCGKDNPFIRDGTGGVDRLQAGRVIANLKSKSLNRGAGDSVDRYKNGFPVYKLRYSMPTKWFQQIEHLH